VKLLAKMVAGAVALASLAAPAAALACDENGRRVEYNSPNYYDPAYSYAPATPRVQVYLPDLRPFVPHLVVRPLFREARYERRWHARHGHRW
jgi:hypothetical protein